MATIAHWRYFLISFPALLLSGGGPSQAWAQPCDGEPCPPGRHCEFPNGVDKPGRCKPNQPPPHTVFVDWRNLGLEDGTAAHPYRNVSQAVTAVAPGGTIEIRAGSYPFCSNSVVLNKPAFFRAESGLVTISSFSDEWPRYRYGNARTGVQPCSSPLADPNRVGNLHCVWSWPPDGQCGPGRKQPPAGSFKASPIVVNGTVFIGSTNGYFYALDAATGFQKWQFPKASDPPLLGACNNFADNGSYGAWGIYSSATYAKIYGQDAVIFGASDPAVPPIDPATSKGWGSSTLFALDFSGNLIWKSGPVARVTGCHSGSTSERHERVAYSAPLVFGNKIYVGIHDSGDDPIQQGRVAVVDLSTGNLVAFPYASTGTLGDGTHGGGVWNSLATDGTGIFFTTGNTRIPPCMSPYNCPPPGEPEPAPNHGLSMVRVDKDAGNIIWSFQPVPFNRDGDPDWAAGAAVMSASCGELVASVQKDGWSYAVNSGDGSLRWQFPATGFGAAFLNAVHGDDDYKRPGTAWNDVLIINTGGEALTHDGVSAGYGKLHALNACAPTQQDRVRWIADLSQYSSGGGYSIGASSVTGGLVYIGTDKGNLVVLADPSVVSANAQGVQQVCSNPDYSLSACPAPYVPVWSLKPIKVVPVPDGGTIAGLRNEPALAKGRVFVSTCVYPCDARGKGHVYMLEP